MNCTICKEKQWSQFDQNYLSLHGICWSCDKRKWEKGELLLKEFEKKEKEAAKK